jgi:two-component system cell cycle sensor histidine kinase PleC
VRRLLLALLGLQTAALGLKALDDWNQSGERTLALQQAFADQLASDLFAQAQLAHTRLALGASDIPAGAVAIPKTGLGTIRVLSELARSTDPRLSAIARTGASLLEAQEAGSPQPGLGVTAQGDLVVALRQPGEADRVAFGAASDVLGDLREGIGVSLFGTARVDLGATERLAGVETAVAAAGFTDTQSGTVALACAGIGSGGVTLCTASPRPGLTATDLARIGFYALLIFGPALALFGLSRRAEREARARKVADSEKVGGEALVDLVMRAAGAGHWEWRESQDRLLLSSHLASRLGLSGETDTPRADVLNTILPADQPLVEAALDEASRTGVLLATFRTRMSDGRTWLEMRGQRLPANASQPARFLGIVLDVTDQKMSEARLRAAEARLRTAIEGFSGPFALWDKRKRLILWNSAFVTDFGLADVAREGISYESIDLTRRSNLKAEREVTEERRSREVRLRDGRWLKLVERPTPDGGMISVGVDVSAHIETHASLARQSEDLKKTVAQLQHAETRAGELSRKHIEEKQRAEQASKAKSAFLANVSHELRTPLNAINGFSQMLVREIYGPLGDSRYHDYAGDILASGKHLLDMINDILDMAKIEAGKMTISTRPISPVDPVDAAIRIIRHRAEDKGLRLTLEVPSEPLPLIEADHRAVRQMVLNLVSNAVKFTPEGGRVTVNLSVREGFVRIAVRDSGIGIRKDDIPRLARPFEQVHTTTDRTYEGTGLGLALTKSFAEMHGGKLAIASEFGKGTLVAVYIPVAEPERVASIEQGFVEDRVASQSP